MVRVAHRPVLDAGEAACVLDLEELLATRWQDGAAIVDDGDTRSPCAADAKVPLRGMW